MSFLTDKKLIFFNSKGEDLNFTFDSDAGFYKGTMYLPTISTYLIHSINIFLFEEFNVSGETKYGQPQDTAAPVEETLFRIEYTDKNDERFKFYDFIEENSLKVMSENSSQTESTDGSNRTTGTSNGIATTNAVDGEGIKIKAIFSAGEEGSFENTIRITAVNQDDLSETVVAEIFIYTEVEEHDERLGTLINNFYKDVEVDQQDFFIFKDVDIKEGYPDWTIINTKLKELLLTGKDLKNYQGSYRGLITAIRYFGYDSLRIKEFFENVDENSKEFGKLRFKEVKDQFDGVIDPFVVDEQPLPNKVWKKTAQFGLAYDINRVTGDFDEFGLPLTEDAFDFTNDEILIKLQGLKEKLKAKFLPLSSRIISITGEGNYFTKYDLNTWNEAHKTNKINVGEDALMEVIPNECGFIINLNSLLIDIDSIVRQDAQLVVPATQNTSYSTGFNNAIAMAITAIEIENVTVNGNDFFVNGVDYELSGDGNTLNWTSSNFTLEQNDDIIISYTYSVLDTPIEDWNPNYTVSYNKLKEDIVDQTIILDTKYTHTFIDHIINGVEDPALLADDEDTPVGCPLTLKDDTFELTWDDAIIDWNLADEGVNGNLSSWDTIKFGPYYEIEWIVTKRVDSLSPQTWEYVLRGDIATFESINLILPYRGVYDITMKLYDTFNTFTTEKRVFEAIQKELEIVGTHRAFRTNETWETLTADWQDTRYPWAINLTNDLTWDEATVSWLKTNKRNFSDIRNFNDLENFTYDKLGFGNWDQLDHLWWDGTRESIDYNPYSWNDWSLRNWNDFYKNEIWDGNRLASDSPAFFEILEVGAAASLTIGERVNKTYDVTTSDPLLGTITQTFDYKYIFTRFTSPASHPEGNLLSITDSPGNTLLSISRDSNNYITHIDGTPVERGFVQTLAWTHDGSNPLISQPNIDEVISFTKNGTALEDPADYTISAGDPQVINYNVAPINGDEFIISYYSTENFIRDFDSTTQYVNQNSSTLDFDSLDEAFYTTLNIGTAIQLELPDGRRLNRTVIDVSQAEGGTLTSPNRIKYSGGNLLNIVRIYNTSTSIEILEDFANEAPLKPVSEYLLSESLGVYAADLGGEERERQVFEVDGDSLSFSAGATDLEVAYSELISSDLPNFTKFNWNIVYEEDEVTVNRIQGTAKVWGESQASYIEVEDMRADLYAPAITLNYNWNELRVFENRKKIPLFSQINFSYDNSGMPGKQLIGDWELTHVDSNTSFTLSEEVFSHFFNLTGEYIMKLSVNDSNGNTQELVKQGLVVVE